VPKIPLYKSTLEGARDRASLTDQELERVHSLISKLPSGMPRVELADYPMALVRAILEDSKLRPAQRAALTLYIYGVSETDLNHDHVYAMKVSNPIDFGSALSVDHRPQPNAEMHWNGRWYPVILRPVFTDDENKIGKVVHLKVSLALGDEVHELQWHVPLSLFTDDQGNPIELTVMQVIEHFDMRRSQSRAADYNTRLVRAAQLAASHGTQIWVRGAVLELQSRFWFGRGLSQRPLGTPSVPRRAIVEANLETGDGYSRQFGSSRRSGSNLSPMPLVRVFSLDTKSYVYADIDDLELYEYDLSALSRLYLPDKMKGVLKQLFETPTESLFGDIIRGKHGGIVILACGNPGVGKTLTAEVYAEMAQRPLYVLEFGELGTSVREIEEHLEVIFARVVRWRAVLQFDECEIFLSQRGEDLERSAIVGIFLRMLDYYEGLLFLTTNRAETLDYAIRSRVMLQLDYPNLDESARMSIWKTMFASANLDVQGDLTPLAQAQVNGRQIRNLVRLARILHPTRHLAVEEMLNILTYACR
jgi:hypothetical protein